MLDNKFKQENRKAVDRRGTDGGRGPDGSKRLVVVVAPVPRPQRVQFWIETD